MENENTTNTTDVIAKVDTASTNNTTKQNMREMQSGNAPEMCEIDDEDCDTSAMGQMPSDMGQMPSMGEPGTLATTATGSNEWLVPMTATGIISGAIILSAVAVCLTIFLTRKKN
ncbi:hypothetical protein IJJ37_02790 [Candidatus Saccharibacteria bacterium]|nr:hypothetical protein [Candidatus Saccharibacteria bacterium]